MQPQPNKSSHHPHCGVCEFITAKDFPQYCEGRQILILVLPLYQADRTVGEFMETLQIKLQPCRMRKKKKHNTETFVSEALGTV